jgi:hypothetical protein
VATRRFLTFKEGKISAVLRGEMARHLNVDAAARPPHQGRARAETFGLGARTCTVPPSRMKRPVEATEFRIPLFDAAMNVIGRRGATTGLLFLRPTIHRPGKCMGVKA